MTGAVVGTLFLVGVALTNVYTCKLLLRGAVATGAVDYEGLSYAVGGFPLKASRACFRSTAMHACAAAASGAALHACAAAASAADQAPALEPVLPSPTCPQDTYPPAPLHRCRSGARCGS